MNCARYVGTRLFLVCQSLIDGLVEVENQLSALVIVRKYLAAVKERGSACDVACLARPLHDRVAELRRFDATKRIKLASHCIVVTFLPAFGHRHSGNVVGSLDEKTVDKGSI